MRLLMRSATVLTFMLLLGACNPPPLVEEFPPPETDLTSAGQLNLTVSPQVFYNVGEPLKFQASAATLQPGAMGNYVLLNGQFLSSAQYTVTGQDVTVSGGTLTEGKNTIEVAILDTSGKTLITRGVIWAGANTLKVKVVDQSGAAVQGAAVKLRLGDDEAITLTQVSQAGEVTFTNLPNRTVALTGSSGTQVGSTAITGGQGQVTLTLLGFKAVSTVDNNDFSQALQGWETGSAPVQLIPHVEGPLGALHSPAVQSLVARTARTTVPSSPPLHALAADMDLSLSTSGEGPQSVSRTFQVEPGTQAVTVRYRFITSEVPGGYFGTKYNDFYNVNVRSQKGAGTVTDGNSMNALGLAAFDAAGATAWREVTLPVNTAGDIVQVDAQVANVADGQLDSSVVIDLVKQSKLSVTAKPDPACINQNVVFTAQAQAQPTVNWSTSGQPNSGTGLSFTTRFGTATNNANATATQGTESASAKVKIKRASGAAWKADFPTSTSVDDLEPSFSANVKSFMSALQAAGASVTVSATYRPEERGHLMHYAWRVAKEGLNPESVPEKSGVEICWQHYDQNGNKNPTDAKAAAQAMVESYGIVYKPSLTSRHFTRQAIDMSISWTGNLKIKNQAGTEVTITTTPRNGTNPQLASVGASFGVNKLASDPPHWSTDGH